MKRIEILAPAGSYESLEAAVLAGADAVYVGGNKFGARAFANNFSEEQMLEAIDFVHLHDRKIYMTVNTLLKEKEIENELYQYIEPYYRQGLDAVIVQDLGVLSFLRQHFPDLPIHASTQMTVTNVLGAKFLEGQGVERVVTSRELQLEEVREITEQTNLEVESFVHGALCYCYSGQCLYSSMIGGRSGNRGQCAQPCRLPYKVGKSGKESYVLSLKDICTLDYIPELCEAGIYSFKIEGRMKKPEYVAAVTAMYRKYADLYLTQGKKGFAVSRKDKEMLMDIYNRGGFHGGYYHTRNGREMISLSRPNHAGVEAVKVLKQQGKQVTAKALRPLEKGDVLEMPDKKEMYTVGQAVAEGQKISFVTHKHQRISDGMSLYRTRNEKLLSQIKNDIFREKVQEKIKGNLILSPGKSAILQLQWKQIAVEVEGAVAEIPQNSPLDVSRIEKQMKKTGNTPFQFEEIQVCVKEEVFLPMQQLNELRRKGLEALEAKIVSQYRRSGSEEVEKEKRGREAKILDAGRSLHLQPEAATAEMYAYAEQGCQLEPIAEASWISRVYIDCNIFPGILQSAKMNEAISFLHEKGKTVFLAMPHIFRDRTRKRYEKNYGKLEEQFDGVLVRNMESVQFLREHSYEKTIVADHHIYQFNHYAKEFWEKYVSELSAPLELNCHELSELGCEGMELLIYGYLPMMVSAQCVQKTTAGCVHQTGFLTMKDRCQKSFQIKNCCEECYNIIYNTAPVVLIDQKREIERLSPAALRLAFTLEDEQRTRQMLALYQEVFLNKAEIGELPFEFTRGHFKRGIK